MKYDDLSEWGQYVSDWAAHYHRTLRERPVRAQTKPGDIAAQLPVSPPETAEGMAQIMADFERIVIPGITHWQHPRFFAYFPANAAPASILADMLINAIAANTLLWQTSPAATEMETVMIDWLRQALSLPEGYSGVIQDGASSATLSAVLTMRERATNWRGNREGLSQHGKLRIYCSDQVHSSIDRAIWIAGIGQENLVKIPASDDHAMDAGALDAAILKDIAAGYTPAGIIAVTGATGIGACDRLADIADVAHKHDLYCHLDAAWAGSAMICPEFRDRYWTGADRFDSIVFNPHKWLGAQFDCSVHFLRDPAQHLDTLKIQPEYLKTTGGDVTNHSEWTVQLGRRFRSLKLWFLIRAYGLEGLRSRIRNHVTWAKELCETLRTMEGITITSEPILSLFSFRIPGDDAAQQRFVDAVNDDGRIYITQGVHAGQKVVRFQAGQFDCTRDDVMMAATVISEIKDRA